MIRVGAGYNGSMKALSVRQPWAWLIAQGYKTVENRTWATNYRGPLLIHAGKKPDLTRSELDEIRRIFREEGGIDIPADLPTGGIVGVVELVDCVQECADPDDAVWHEPGFWAWVLRDARPLPFQPVSGRLGLFEVNDAHLIDQLAPQK